MQGRAKETEVNEIAETLETKSLLRISPDAPNGPEALASHVSILESRLQLYLGMVSVHPWPSKEHLRIVGVK